MIKYSRQRECIKACLAARCDHPTAEALYGEVKKQCPNISLGTVYRNLALLSELGEIQKITVPSGPDRFDACMEPHYHFMCRCCGQICDIMPSESVKLFIAQDAIPGTAENCSVQIRGLCRACANKIN